MNTNEKSLLELIRKLPPDMTEQVRNFIEFLLSKRARQTEYVSQQGQTEVLHEYQAQYTFAPTRQFIVQTPEVAGNKPRINGRRITVQNIAIWHEYQGYSVDEIADQHNLSLSAIYAALSYYFDHKQEIDASITADTAYADDLRQQTPSLLAQKLYERVG